MIYLDAAATTMPYPEVVERIKNTLENYWGNASSNYSFGQTSKNIIEKVREQIARDINCSPEEVIFTGSGCEANSLALKGFLGGSHDKILITTRMEHASIKEFENNTSNLKMWVENDHYGNVSVDSLTELLEKAAFVHRTPLVSIAGANSEIGTIQDIKKLCDLTHSFGGVFHSDMTALYPHRRINVQELGIDMMTVSGQKFHATEGVGFLYVKKGIELAPIIYGTQENKLRGGSYNTALIDGMGEALQITRYKADSSNCRRLRDKLLGVLLDIPGVMLNGPSKDENRLENNINVTIKGVDAETLVTLCDSFGICISKGSACHSHEPIPSSVLKALGYTDEEAMSTIRITLDDSNTEEEIDQCITIIPALIERIRN